MTAHPITLTAAEVRATLDGRKTMIRRPIRFPLTLFLPDGHTWELGKDREDSLLEWLGKGAVARCPFGQPGDRLWVKEPYAIRIDDDTGNADIFYASDLDRVVAKYKPASRMPRYLSRLSLETVSRRVERVQHISECDAKEEGAHPCLWYQPYGKPESESVNLHSLGFEAHVKCYICHRNGFANDWDSRYAKLGYGWDDNPMVWVGEYKVVES